MQNEVYFEAVYAHRMTGMEIKRIAGNALDAILRQPNVTSNQTTPSITSHAFEAIVLQATLKNQCIDQYFSAESGRYFSENVPCSLNGLAPELNSIVDRPHQVDVTETIEANESVSLSLDQFVQVAWDCAKTAANRMGLDPKVLMAQAALETGWGQFIAKKSDGTSSHNLFNIKTRADSIEDSVNIKTTEFIGNVPINVLASFKAYSSIEDSFHDYVALIESSPRYQVAAANAHDPKQYIAALHEAGYATDPNYTQKILSIYEGQPLQQALERNGCV